jgi:hypothetical protein
MRSAPQCMKKKPIVRIGFLHFTLFSEGSFSCHPETFIAEGSFSCHPEAFIAEGSRNGPS